MAELPEGSEGNRVGKVLETGCVACFYVVGYMPWIAAVVIGGMLTWFNVVELHRSPWWAVLLMGLPLSLAAGLHYLFTKDSEGSRNELGFGCGLIPLVLLLILWPVFMRAHSAEARRARLRHSQTTGRRSLSAPVGQDGSERRWLLPSGPGGQRGR